MRADDGDEVGDVLRGFHFSDAEADFEALFDRDKQGDVGQGVPLRPAYKSETIDFLPELG